MGLFEEKKKRTGNYYSLRRNERKRACLPYVRLKKIFIDQKCNKEAFPCEFSRIWSKKPLADSWHRQLASSNKRETRLTYLKRMSIIPPFLLYFAYVAMTLRCPSGVRIIQASEYCLMTSPCVAPPFVFASQWIVFNAQNGVLFVCFFSFTTNLKIKKNMPRGP